jgi:Smg protein
MFDILVYLFENYLEVSAYPDENKLTRELSAAGFERGEINLAISWMHGLESLVHTGKEDVLAAGKSTRFFTEREIDHIGVEGVGLITFLEGSGVLDPVQREWIVDRAFAIDEQVLSLEQVKWIILFVLWSQNEPQQFLFVEDFLFGDVQPTMH